jgi:hypothetical protein
MVTSNDASGFWTVVGQAVDTPDFLERVRRQPKESDEDYRKRLEALKDVQLSAEDVKALLESYDGKTIIDLIAECKSTWPGPVSASYRT